MAQTSVLLIVTPSEAAIEPGETIELTVRVEDAVNLYGVELRLNYDPAILQVVDADGDADGIQALPGPFLDVDQGFLVANQADNEAGQLVYAATLLSPAEPVAGNGILLEVSLRGAGIGTSPLDLDSSILASPEGQALPLVTQGGHITVGDPGPQALATPTATSVPPTPTQPAPAETATPGNQGQVTATAHSESTATTAAPGSTSESPVTPGRPGDEQVSSQATTMATAASGPTVPVDVSAAAMTTELNDATTGTETEPAPAVASSTDDDGSESLPNAITSPGDGAESGVEPAGDNNGIWAVAVSVLVFVVIAGALFFGRRLLTHRG
ncbi:MAG: hypothetical protein JSW55_01775 [Chloroflexota bacterium]|nr:MAG: hypothetical protein JSW55_01775 [Chloroflexota bacterium]